MKTVTQILAGLEARAPLATAEGWDNVGLLVGTGRSKTAGAVVSIDLTEKAIRTARAKGYRLIVNHHPCIFPKSRGITKVQGLVHEAASQGVEVISLHTNFDRCALEVVDAVSRGLGLSPGGRLHEATGDLLKLVVFVPETHSEQVRTAICGAGAGQIGAYDSCTFGSTGEGTFRGGEGTSPFLGRAGRLERAREVRLETILPTGFKSRVLKALFEAHPYEEVAYDLYALEQKASGSGLVSGLGYGFWGDFKKPRSFSEVARGVKSLFQLEGYWVSQPVPSRVRRMAFVAGKGASFIQAAAEAGCDLFVTGEAGYHDVLRGARTGMTVMEIGHRESERFFLSTVSGWLKADGLKTVSLNDPTQRVFS